MWTVCLTAHEGPPSESFFPLEVGHWWRFRWLEEAGDNIMFEDLCRVVDSGEGRACFSSATWAFDGIGLLGREVGASCTDVHNTSLGGICESMRMRCAVKSDRESVEVLAGRFSGCVLIETVISTSAEGRPLEEELLETARGYFAGVKEAWFAPGVGLVRLRYRHRNGYETQVELLEYETAQESKSYLPLALDNRWRYAWTDQESGTRFEDRLRVASHRESRWNFAFVTRAEMAENTAIHP